ncbi:arpA protein [Frankia sp. CNm7]|uniref:ArpA protein n=1 Tax=Frankia nepalensis TaxID=1836974 RepID=A0A937RA49_9ACTN|nr:arpA protein [Frankia nepalensis]MBL7502638.1 arpA protein [Frankia nepalensis]MBL7514850.1 arpA protein [Frankia nepalensis]MBL7520881.1 arpA protein [Frankia nepalensis]MBL7626542.1 arpA protein [Frankia nepalensis]
MTGSETVLDDFATAAAVEAVVNTEFYPLFAPPGSAAWNGLVLGARRELAESGCCVLPGFVRPEALEPLRAQCAALAPLAYYGDETVNAYNIAPDTPLPSGHPGRVSMPRGNAFVARDRIPADHAVQRLYTSVAFQTFVAACFELPAVHELADSLAGLCVNVVAPGREHPWHFDTNEFAVSLLTQEADGGEFEYCPGIRSAAEENVEDVAAVLAGRGDRLVQRLRLRPGDLQLFLGRYSLHRVSRVTGPVERHSVIFAYSARPGVVGSLSRTRQLFGRVLPEHQEAADQPVRVDALLD